MAIVTALDKALVKLIEKERGHTAISIVGISLEGSSESNCCCDSSSVDVNLDIQYSTETVRWNYYSIEEYSILTFLEDLTDAVQEVHAESLGLVTFPKEK